MHEVVEEPKPEENNLEDKLFRSDDSDNNEKLSMFSEGSFQESRQKEEKDES